MAVQLLTTVNATKVSTEPLVDVLDAQPGILEESIPQQMVCSKNLIIANSILKAVVTKDLFNWTKIDAINVKHADQEHNTMLLLIHASMLHQSQFVDAIKSSKLDLTHVSNAHLVNFQATLQLTKLEDVKLLLKTVMPEVKSKEASNNAMLAQLADWVKLYS